MSQLWGLVQAFLDRQPLGGSERELARVLRYKSSSSFVGWREPKRLPSAQALARFAKVSGTPYQRVLDAALADIGYLPEPQITDEDLQYRRDTSGRRSRGQRTRDLDADDWSGA